MGFGGMTALGCTIGQGLTGLLDPGAGLDPRPSPSIVAGSARTMKYQYWRMMREA